MLLLSVVPFSYAGNEEYPIVYLSGCGFDLFDANGNKIDAKDVEKDYIINATKEGLKEMPVNPNGDWSKYCDAFYNSFAPLYDDVRLNKDGEPVDGGAAHVYRSINWLPRKSSNYGCHDYHFNVEDESLTPVVSGEPTKREEPKDFFKALFNFFTRLFRYLKDAFKK